MGKITRLEGLSRLGYRSLTTPTPPPAELDRRVRLASLPEFRGHYLWIQKNKQEILNGLKISIQRFIQGHFENYSPPPRGTSLYIYCQFIDREGVHSGYHVGGIQEHKGKTDFLSSSNPLLCAMDFDPELVRYLAMAAEIDNFLHVKITFDSNGRIDEYREIFSVPAGLQETVMLAGSKEDIRVPDKASKALMLHDQVRLQEIGLKPYRIPMLLLPGVARKYIGEVAFLQEALRRAFAWGFGDDLSFAPHPREDSYYAWWLKMWGHSGEHERLVHFAATGDEGTLIPWDETTRAPAVPASIIALRSAHMGALAVRMADFVTYRRPIRDLPKNWECLDSHLRDLLGEGYERIKAIVKEYNLARALIFFKMTRNRPDEFKGELADDLRRFNADYLREDEVLFQSMTGPALETRIIHYLIENHLKGDAIPFDKIDEALEAVGLLPSTSIAPQTLVEDLIKREERRTTYRDYFDQVTFQVWPFYGFYLKIPMEKRFEADIVNDAVIMLSAESNCLFQEEIEVRSEKGVSYLIWPDGTTKEEAREARKLYRLEIADELGKGRVIMHKDPDRKLV